jgi:hypothetical protein
MPDLTVITNEGNTVELARDVLMMRELTNEIEADVAAVQEDFLTDETREQALICWGVLEEAYKVLAGIKADLGERLAESMPEKSVVVENVGVFERHRKATRTQWDRDDLLRAVLDTVMVDTETGEIIPETPLEKVMAVWTLPAPKVTAIRERGLQVDEFCHEEYGKQTLRLVT